MFYISQQIGYYSGERIFGNDIVVPERPASYYEWNGSAWVINPTLQAIYNRFVADEGEQLDGKNDAAILALLDQTKAQWISWVTTNLTFIALPAERNRIGTLFWVVAMCARKILR